MDPFLPKIVIRELEPALLGDWLAFFDRDAFLDNREWAGCHCHLYHADYARGDWEARTPAENRAASAELTAMGCFKGHLAYSDGRPIGWCQAAPRHAIPT